MNHIFDVIIAGKFYRYSRYEDIPERIDQVVRFAPEIPPGPHTQEQHDEIESWLTKFEQLLERTTWQNPPQDVEI